MVNEKFIVEEDRVAIMLVTSVGIDLPNNLGTGEGTDLDHESTLPAICCLLKTSQVAIGFDMSENNLSPVKNKLSLFVFKVIIEHVELVLGLLIETLHICGSECKYCGYLELLGLVSSSWISKPEMGMIWKRDSL